MDNILGIKQIAAHKGLRPYPDNTIRSVIAAIEVGYEIVEVDVASTKDNVLVLLHDIEKMGGGRITQRSYSELNKLYFDSFGRELDKLEDLFKAIYGKNVIINLDCADISRLKITSIFSIIKLIKKYKIEKNVYIEVPNRYFVLYYILGKDLLFEIVIVKEDWKFRLLKLFRGLIKRAIILNRKPTPWLITWAHNNNYKISYWTANNKDEVKALWDMGYDIVGINT